MKLAKDFGIRALLSVLVVGGAVAGALWLIFKGQADLGMGFLASAASGAIGYYFGQHVKNGEVKPQ